MKTMTVEEVREHFEETVASLAEEGEVVITSGSIEVAKLVPMEPVMATTKRFDPEENRRWLDEFWGPDVVFDSLPGLQADRDERKLPG